jgi:hypothetical protein
VKKRTKLYGTLLVTLVALTVAGCKKKTKDPKEEIKGNYFSVRQFALDEWNTYAGEPFLINKTVRVNDVLVDSSTTNSDTLNWGNIFKIFFETDISDRSFLGLYGFNQFDDNADDTHNFFYEAKDDDLDTKKLLITISQYNNKVKGVYIESVKKDMFDETLYKLYYKPMKTIQIQSTETPLFGSKKHTVTEYEFVR